MLPNVDSIPPQDPDTIRAWDRRTIDEFGVPGIVLMENAGSGAARIITRELRKSTGPSQDVAVLCGPGNNGGDGFVVARHLHNAGVTVRVVIVGQAPGQPPRYRPGSDAAVFLDVVRRMKLPVEAWGDVVSHGRAQIQGWIVDALFGTGLSRDVATPYDEAIEVINAAGSQGAPVFALDVPSGLDARTGEVLGVAVQATHTLTFAASKVGFSKAAGPRCCGAVHVIDIGMPREVWTRAPKPPTA